MSEIKGPVLCKVRQTIIFSKELKPSVSAGCCKKNAVFWGLIKSSDDKTAKATQPETRTENKYQKIYITWDLSKNKNKKLKKPICS